MVGMVEQKPRWQGESYDSLIFFLSWVMGGIWLGQWIVLIMIK
jgi:hypothetical protein